MGIQGSRGNTATIGLCNAALLSRRHAPFCKRWIRSYAFFTSRGRDVKWDFHSVKLPNLLSREMPDEVTVLSSRAFFYPLWDSIERMVLAENTAGNAKFFSEAYVVHFWGTLSGALDRIRPEFVQTSSSLYAAWAREALQT
jgi:hypothetical protein